MLPKDDVSLGGNPEAVWNRYCGFLDLSPEDFRRTQEHLLLESLEQVAASPLARRFLPAPPRSVEEFRAAAPLTRWEDYADVLDARDASGLAAPPAAWARTSGRGGTPKWIPYPERFLRKLSEMAVASLLLACAERKGEVRVQPGLRVLLNMPSPPYLTGILHDLLVPALGARILPPPEEGGAAEFERKMRKGFEAALRGGVDLVAALSSVLVRMGEDFEESTRELKVSDLIGRPRALARVAAARLRSRGEGVLPKDLWRLKGLLCYGMDTQIYRDAIRRYWGRNPFECYGATETGVLAVNGWRKRALTFLPYACYLEFLPMDGTPSDMVPYGRVETGFDYEVVVTSFYGMPFLRYRLGDVVRFTAPRDEEAGIRLPQAVFQARTADLIDVAGFVQLDEKSVSRAIADSGLPVTEWTARKERHGGHPAIRLFLETRAPVSPDACRTAVAERLASLNADWREMVSMLGGQPLEVSLLPPGSFQRYYERRRREGAEAAHWKPPRMNPADSVLAELLQGG